MFLVVIFRHCHLSGIIGHLSINGELLLVQKTKPQSDVKCVMLVFTGKVVVRDEKG